VSCGDACKPETTAPGEWPTITHLQKPWTRWWWMGNAVDKENITKNLESFAAAGIGGVEITPIYGVKGYEDQFIDFLSPKYMEMLQHTINEAERLGMQVDMVLGTGWPFGGPQVDPEYAATRLAVQKYSIIAGDSLGVQIEINDQRQKALAKLIAVLAFDDQGHYDDVTAFADSTGTLNWSPNEGEWTIYAVFAAKTRQMVKRAAPGGVGYTLDHFSSKAWADYTEPYDSTLNGVKLRAIFNDSYEVYGADFTPEFFSQFRKFRGYDLKPLMAKFVDGDSLTRNHLLTDYRETINDLLLNEFTLNWKKWSNKNKYLTKFQAHGSPGNLIDLYAASDIPECETFGSTLFNIPGLRRDSSDIRHVDPDPVMLKFASSAGHLAGRPLISSESFTWLADHFKASLSQCKPELEQLFLSGVNHVFFHGATYSPFEAPWPGWKFYASMNFNHTNPIWKDAPAFFSYIARCQSILQTGRPDNELLVYWPYYDALATASPSSMYHQFGVHSIDKWLHPTNFYKIIIDLKKEGYSFDFISDKFIAELSLKNGMLVTPGGRYKALIVPSCERMLPESLKKLEELKKRGANIVFEGLPCRVPGYFELEKREKEINDIATRILSTGIGTGTVSEKLNLLGIKGEPIAAVGLDFIKRKSGAGTYYFVVNHTAGAIDQYITLRASGKSVVLFDALTGKKGKAKTKDDNGLPSVLVQLEPGETCFIGVFNSEVEIPSWDYIGVQLPPVLIEGEWNVRFIEGGPILPEPFVVKEITPWETWSKQTEAFSGTARYSITFDLPEAGSDDWILDLGNVRESARVSINGNKVGTAWGIPFKLRVGKLMKAGENLIEIDVTNLGANRIRDLEKSGQEWKIFYEINMVDVGYKKFDATKWNPMPSGLTTTPKLIPVNYLE
jgi:hypothetical protein